MASLVSASALEHYPTSALFATRLTADKLRSMTGIEVPAGSSSDFAESSSSDDKGPLYYYHRAPGDLSWRFATAVGAATPQQRKDIVTQQLTGTIQYLFHEFVATHEDLVRYSLGIPASVPMFAPASQVAASDAAGGDATAAGTDGSPTGEQSGASDEPQVLMPVLFEPVAPLYVFADERAAFTTSPPSSDTPPSASTPTTGDGESTSGTPTSSDSGAAASTAATTTYIDSAVLAIRGTIGVKQGTAWAGRTVQDQRTTRDNLESLFLAFVNKIFDQTQEQLPKQSPTIFVVTESQQQALRAYYVRDTKVDDSSFGYGFLARSTTTVLEGLRGTFESYETSQSASYGATAPSLADRVSQVGEAWRQFQSDIESRQNLRLLVTGPDPPAPPPNAPPLHIAAGAVALVLYDCVPKPSANVALRAPFATSHGSQRQLAKLEPELVASVSLAPSAKSKKEGGDTAQATTMSPSETDDKKQQEEGVLSHDDLSTTNGGTSTKGTSKSAEGNENGTDNDDADYVPVVLDHDGGVDDFMALIILAAAHVKGAVPATGSMREADALLTSARPIGLLGVTVMDADCHAKPAVEVCRRLLAKMGSGLVANDGSAPRDVLTQSAIAEAREELLRVPVAASPLTAAGSGFPDAWRMDSDKMVDQPEFQTSRVRTAMARRVAPPFSVNPQRVTPLPYGAQAPLTSLEKQFENKGHELLAHLVMKAPAPVTIVVTGPLSNVAWAIKTHGKAFTDKVRQVVIMGGALDVPGNVHPSDISEAYRAKATNKEAPIDDSGEWNIFWDAPAARVVLENPDLCAARKLTLFSLDSTNAVPVTSKFVSRFADVDFNGATNRPPRIPVPPPPTSLAQFVGGAWATTTWFSVYFGENRGYYAWDALTAAYVVNPALAQTVPSRIAVVDESHNMSEGRTVRVDRRPIRYCSVTQNDPPPSIASKDSVSKSESDAISRVRNNDILSSASIGNVDVATAVNSEVFYDMMLAMCGLVL